MKVIIDYDNDQIRIGLDHAFENSQGIGVVNMKVKNIHEFKPVLIELINMICDGNDHPPISLESQDEGRISIIEEY